MKIKHQDSVGKNYSNPSLNNKNQSLLIPYNVPYTELSKYFIYTNSMSSL